jgi:hypothetical protein
MPTKAKVTPVAIEREADLDEQKTLDRIKHYIDQPPVNSRVFRFTPMIAETVLRDFNKKNRPKKPRQIALYAADMAAGMWPLTGDTLKFSDAKRLADGQNRFMACLRAGVPFSSHVVFGIDDAAFDRLDQGRNRDGADVLAIAGFQNTSALAGAVRWANLIEQDRAKLRDTYQPAEILRLLNERYADLPKFVGPGSAIYRVTRQPQGLVTALLYLFDKVNAPKAAEFGTAWETGNWAGKYTAIGIMQKRLAEMTQSTSGRVHDVVRAALIVIAWNLFVQGRKGRKLDMLWDPAQPFPGINGA